MSVLCCRVPDFLLTLHAPGTHATTVPDTSSAGDVPAALLGPDQRICAVSAAARQRGVHVEMTPQQARMRCPDLCLNPVDLARSQAAQTAFLQVLRQWGLPIETQSWGLAYIDLHELTRARSEVQPLGQELGRGLRQTLGPALQPALGWDSSKFTARAAASVTPPGRMRLVDKPDERRFLAPLSIQLLPLPGEALQQLHWLGIHTLGQFAALPPTAVWQRLGKAGRAAQRWALGQDDRPIRNTESAAAEPVSIALEPPTGQLSPVLAALRHALKPRLEELAQRLEGCRRLYLQLHFANGIIQSIEIICVEPTSALDRLIVLIQARLESLNWPAPLAEVTILQLESAELVLGQMTLFQALGPASDPLAADLSPTDRADCDEHTARWRRLHDKYGPVFYRGEIVQDHHPADERRIRLAAWT